MNAFFDTVEALVFNALYKIYQQIINQQLTSTGDTDFDKQILITLSFETGFLNDSRSTTGEFSRWGISLKTYPDLGINGILALTAQQAANLYYRDFWQKFKCRGFQTPLDCKIFDMTVNPGVGHALVILNTILGTDYTSIIDPDLRRGFSYDDPIVTLNKIRSVLSDYYKAEIAAGRVPAKYLKGLLRRAAS